MRRRADKAESALAEQSGGAPYEAPPRPQVADSLAADLARLTAVATRLQDEADRLAGLSGRLVPGGASEESVVAVAVPSDAPTRKRARTRRAAEPRPAKAARSADTDAAPDALPSSAPLSDGDNGNGDADEFDDDAISASLSGPLEAPASPLADDMFALVLLRRGDAESVDSCAP